MTTIQDRIIEKFREQFDRFPDDYYNGIVGKDGSRFSNTLSGLEELEEFILTSIKEVEEETRKEVEFGCKKLIDNSSVRASILECSQDGYEFGIEDVIKNLSITNKEKQ